MLISVVPQNMLLKMPGVNSKNVFAIMNRVESLADLVTLSLEHLTDILGSVPHAQQLHHFLHRADSGAAGTSSTDGGRPPGGRTATSRFASKRNVKGKGPLPSKAASSKPTKQMKKSWGHSLRKTRFVSRIIRILLSQVNWLSGPFQDCSQKCSAAKKSLCKQSFISFVLISVYTL